MIAPARLAAYEVLRAVSRGASDLPTALWPSARSRLADERDRALAGEIATGTLRWQGAFDAVIAAFAGPPVEKLDGEVLDILRLAAFQFLHLDRIPAPQPSTMPSTLAGRPARRSASGLVNAILRRICRERDHLPLPTPNQLAGRPEVTSTLVPYLATTLSHPAGSSSDG